MHPFLIWGIILVNTICWQVIPCMYGKNKGRLQFIHQAGIGPFAEFFRLAESLGFVKSYHWNYHVKLGLAYAIY
jgi:hypothetical protein